MASVSESMYIGRLEDTADHYYNTYTTIKMEPIDVKSRTLVLKIIIKILNIKLVIT